MAMHLGTTVVLMMSTDSTAAISRTLEQWIAGAAYSLHQPKPAATASGTEQTLCCLNPRRPAAAPNTEPTAAVVATVGALNGANKYDGIARSKPVV